jgi:hypothetical protein
VRKTLAHFVDENRHFYNFLNTVLFLQFFKHCTIFAIFLIISITLRKKNPGRQDRERPLSPLPCSSSSPNPCPCRGDDVWPLPTAPLRRRRRCLGFLLAPPCCLPPPHPRGLRYATLISLNCCPTISGEGGAFVVTFSYRFLFQSRGVKASSGQEWRG